MEENPKTEISERIKELINIGGLTSKQLASSGSISSKTFFDYLTCYIWSQDNMLYTHIEPITEAFSLYFIAFDKFILQQNKTAHDQLFLYDNLGRAYGDRDWGDDHYESKLVVYSPQTFWIKDADGWEHNEFDASQSLTIGLQTDDGPYRSWDIDPLFTDADNDGLPDFWEEKYFSDLDTTNGEEDVDNDGLKNTEEFVAKTDPTDFDTDNDGYGDGLECGDPIDNQTYPRNMDTEPVNKVVVVPLG